MRAVPTNEVVLSGVVAKDKVVHCTYPNGTTLTRLEIELHLVLDKTCDSTKYSINVEIWGEAADVVALHIRNGWTIQVDGYLKVNHWKDEYQCRHTDTVVVARYLQFWPTAVAAEGLESQTVKGALAPNIPDNSSEPPVRAPIDTLYTLDPQSPPLESYSSNYP